MKPISFKFDHALGLKKEVFFAYMSKWEDNGGPLYLNYHLQGKFRK